MSPNHGDGVAGAPFVADGEGDDGAGVAGQIVSAAGLAGGVPAVAFLDAAPISRGFRARLCGGWTESGP